MGRHTKSYFKGIIYGSLIGAGLALIYTPRKGEQSLELLREVADETRQRTEEFARMTKDRANEIAASGADLYSEGKGLVERTLEGIKEGARSFKQVQTED